MKGVPSWLAEFHRQWLAARGRKARGPVLEQDGDCFGDPVNLASRLEALTKVYGVELVVCEATAAAVEGAELVEFE